MLEFIKEAGQNRARNGLMDSWNEDSNLVWNIRMGETRNDSPLDRRMRLGHTADVAKALKIYDLLEFNGIGEHRALNGS